jgi:hypothetical protein
MNSSLSKISSKLTNGHSGITNPGLLYGKLGICIALYHISKRLNDSIAESTADNIIEEIFSNIRLVNEVNFEDGLSGIGWGLCYLKDNKFICGDVDDALTIVDDRIYQFLEFNDNVGMLKLEVIIGIGFYLLRRLEDELDANDKYLLNELMILLINNLATVIERDKNLLDEPPCFNIYYRLPLCLAFLNMCYDKDIYRIKIKHIYDYLTPIVNSVIPLSNANKAYLWTTINDNHLFDKHALLLKDNGVFDDNKFSINDISLLRGKLGFILLMKLLYNNHSMFTNSGIINDIISTPILSTMDDLSLMRGLSGIGLILSKYY